MRSFFIILWALLTAVGCGDSVKFKNRRTGSGSAVSEAGADAKSEPETSVEPSGEPSSSVDELDQRVQAWMGLLPFCDDFPAKENCDDGDATLFNGLLCAAGIDKGCDAVRRAQSANGRWWRSPRRVDGNMGEGNSFSRDMALGVLLYLAKTEDRSAADRWLDWIEKNRPCSVVNPATGGCSVRGLHRVCTDDSDNRCTLTPNVWSLMGQVWDHLGLSRHPNMDQFANSYQNAAATEARQTDLGYGLHLKAVSAFMLSRVERLPETTKEVAQILADRQPDNPFFRYLKEGFSDTVRTDVLRFCPSVGPEASWAKRQWSWERDTASEAWRETMVWDCLFMAKLR